jgi:hypothetical protein
MWILFAISGIGIIGVFGLMWFVEKVLARERTDSAYAVKLTEFRLRIRPLIPSEKAQGYIVIIVIVIVFILFSTTSDYEGP